MKNIFGMFLGILVAAGQATADQDGAYLDAKYNNLVNPVVVEGRDDNMGRSDILGLIAMQTPVKSQGARGTCSIFSAIAMLESMLVINRNQPTTLDLSEEYLEYIAMKNRTSDGSSSYSNFSYLSKNGAALEQTWNYVGQDWTKVSSDLAVQRCGKLEEGSVRKTSCLLGHRDPNLMAATDAQLSNPNSGLYDLEFLNIRKEAKSIRSQLMTQISSNYYVGSVQDVKALLKAGIPVTLDVDFYYGAWNHSKAPELGITRNMDHWYKGIVGYPAVGSIDRDRSNEMPAGHSVLVVGYDDDVEVTIPTQMTDGTTKNMTYKGVYYIKNSWGSGNFGVNFSVDGKSFPGYGMLVQKYAHEFGGFYQLDLN